MGRTDSSRTTAHSNHGAPAPRPGMRLAVALAMTAIVAVAAGSPVPPSPVHEKSRDPSLPFEVPGAPKPPGFGRAAAKARPEPATLAELLASVPADSLAAPLRHFEAEHGRTGEGADAAFALGQFHYARGEYRQAADAFGRAAARYAPERKGEARYWQGLAFLGQGDAIQARSVLEDVAEQDSPRRADARFAVAEAWLRAGRPEKSLEVLKALLDDRPDDMRVSALERVAELSERTGDADGAQRATRELERLNPEAVEPVRRPSPPPAPPIPTPATLRSQARIAVQIGAFSEVARARQLVESAREKGFTRAEILTQGRGDATLHLVRIGAYPTEEAARAAGERASRELGVAYRLIRS